MGEWKKKKRKQVREVFGWKGEGEEILVGPGVFFPSTPKSHLSNLERKLGGFCFNSINYIFVPLFVKLNMEISGNFGI